MTTLGNTPELLTIPEAKEAIIYNVKKGIPSMVWGVMGTGKTEMAHQIGAELDRRVVEFYTNLSEPTDMKGWPIGDVEKNEMRFLPSGELPINGKFGENVIMLWDEINTGTNATLNVCLQAMLFNKVGQFQFNANTAHIATGNRHADRGHTQRMGWPLKNRFWHCEIKPDLDAVINHMRNTGIDPYLVAFLRNRGGESAEGRNDGLLLRMPKDDNEHSFPTPRQYYRNVNQAIRDWANGEISTKLRDRLIFGYIGYAAGLEVAQFLAVVHDLAPLEDIVASPATAQLPTIPSAKYAMIGMMTRNANRQNFGKLITYARRIEREYEILFVSDVRKTKPDLMKTQAYIEWAVRNQDIIIDN